MCGDLTSARPACVSGSGYELFHAAILDKSKQGFFFVVAFGSNTVDRMQVKPRDPHFACSLGPQADFSYRIYDRKFLSHITHISFRLWLWSPCPHLAWLAYKRGLFRWFLLALAPPFYVDSCFLRFIEFSAYAKTLPNIYSPPDKIDKMLNCWRWHLAKNIQFCV